MFKALDFVFDGIPNTDYGIYILDIDGSAKKTTQTGSDLDLITQKVPGRPIPYLLGCENSEVLEFTLTFGAMEPLDRDMVIAIQKWLFGKKYYRELKIIQKDMYDYHYECIMTGAKLVTIANWPYAFTCTITCNAPWAWTNEKTYSYNASTEQKIVFRNLSDNPDYDRPYLEITATGSDFYIINESDGGRKFELTGLQSGEVVSVDNDREIITSSTGLNRLDNFNLNFFRLVPGINKLTVNGGSVKIKYKLARKVGA